MTRTEIYKGLCAEANPVPDDSHILRGTYVNPVACAECESPCQLGFELLKTMDEKKFALLLCGGDCNTCRTPCNMRRISLMRGITWARTHREKQSKSWLDVVMRPYYERRKGEDADAATIQR